MEWGVLGPHLRYTLERKKNPDYYRFRLHKFQVAVNVFCKFSQYI